MQPTLVILAAGMGSRYGSLKQVDKLGPQGETIIDYSVFDAMKAGFGKIVFVIRKNIENDFIEAFSDGFLARVPYEIVFQELDMLPEGFSCPSQRIKPWGTVHALWCCRNVVKEPFVVINADDFYGEDAYIRLADFLQDNRSDSSNDYAMCGYKLPLTLSEHGSVTRALCSIDEDGYLVSVDEHFNILRDENGNIVSRIPGSDQLLDSKSLVSMNIWAFNESIFKLIGEEFTEFLNENINDLKAEMYTPGLVDRIIKKDKGKVKVLKTNAQWFGVTYADDKQKVSGNLDELTRKGKYPRGLWK